MKEVTDPSIQPPPPANPKPPMSAKDAKTLHILKLVIAGILFVAFIVFVFGVGVFVGQERARFSYRWAQNYYRNFGGPMMQGFGTLPTGGFISGHGVFGPIIKVDAGDVVVKDQDGVEKTIIVSGNVTIRNNTGAIKFSDLEVGDSIVVIGSPNDQGQIVAQFIRVLPSPGSSFLIIPGNVNAI